MSQKDVLDAALGARALQEKLITPEQLQEALAEQSRSIIPGRTSPRSLGAILVSKGYLTPVQLQNLILAQARPAPASAPGLPPFGKFRLVRELGRGGMGVVYEAIETGLERKVALKTMIAAVSANPKDAKVDEERFLREARLSAGLAKHPHVVGVYEAGVIDGRRYLSMELIAGKPMSEWGEDPKVTLRQQVEVLRLVALAVHHAHEAGVIHRDLKPQNILVDPKGEPHVTDFGLAKMVGENHSQSLTGEGMVVGTPAYISPEQAQGLKTVDRRTDIYALGVMLFEILTGRHPFTGANAMEILMRASKNPVPSASALLKVRLSPEQAKGLDDICQKALAKKPGDRYRTAAGFASDLEKWLRGEEVRVAPSTQRLVRSPRRNGLLIAAAAAVAVVVLLVFLLRGPSGPDPEQLAAERRAAEDKLRIEREKLAAERKAMEDRAKAAERQLDALNARLLKALPVRNPEALRPGLIGEYYGGLNHDRLGLRRIDPDVRFTVKNGPAWPNGPSDLVSTRWRGYLRVPETGTWLFHAYGNDGVRLFIDEAEVLSNWAPRKLSLETGLATLEKGHHALLLESFTSSAPGGITLTLKKKDGPGETTLGTPLFFHDPAAFVAVSQPASMEHFDWNSVPGAQEAETLPILECEPPKATFVIPWGRNRGILIWGGKNTRMGARLKLGFDVRDPGEKTLILGMNRVKNAGIFRITVNGTVLEKELDLYHPGNHLLEFEFKKVLLRPGANELEFTVVGSNPSAVEWNKGDGVMKLAFDYLRIR